MALMKVHPFGRGNHMTSENGMGRCLLHPSGNFRTFWNFMVMGFVMYDLLVIPLRAFTLPFWLSDGFGWVVAELFWVSDFILTFFTGFYDQGILVLDRFRIAREYARTWMIFDLSVLTLEPGLC